MQKLSEISKWRYEFKSTLKMQHESTTNLDSGSEKPEIETYVVQRYILKPFLIGGKKFDLRLYALVTSFHPLNVWLYRGGFGRFSNNKYSTSSESIRNSFVHLTNVAIQKNNENYSRACGTKWDIHSLKLYLYTIYGDEKINQLFYRIEEIIVYSLKSVENVMMQDKRCFELFGYDVLIDYQLKPWLLEVNASPSLAGTNKQDYQFKVSQNVFSCYNCVCVVSNVE